MQKTYEVPVWFRVNADHQDQAWWKVRELMIAAEAQEQLPDYVVEEPVELLTGAVGWNMPPMPEDLDYTPPEEC